MVRTINIKFKGFMKINGDKNIFAIVAINPPSKEDIKGTIKDSGFIIPNITSTIVIIDRKIKTPQIFCSIVLNLSLPLKIAKLCS
jgi:hypothetical protein